MPVVICEYEVTFFKEKQVNNMCRPEAGVKSINKSCSHIDSWESELVGSALISSVFSTMD